MVPISVGYAARNAVPAFPAHHAPFFTRVDRASHEQVYLSGAEVTRLATGILVGWGHFSFSFFCFPQSLISFALDFGSFTRGDCLTHGFIQIAIATICSKNKAKQEGT
jgi:hypothetical protein